MPEKNTIKTILKWTGLVIGGLVIVLASILVFLASRFIFLVITAPTNSIPAVAENDPYSTLVCSGDEAVEALNDVLNTYDNRGDAAAFATADKYISQGTCEYSTKNNYYWWAKGTAPEGFTEFEEPECKELQNGHCVAVQYIYEFNEETQEIVSTAYMLVEPRVADGNVPPPTPAGRSQKGLIFDINF